MSSTLTALAHRLETAKVDDQEKLLIEAFSAAFPVPDKTDIKALVAWSKRHDTFVLRILAEAFESASRMLVPQGRSFILHSADSRYPKDPHAMVFADDWSRFEASATTEGLALGAAALRARAKQC